MKWNYLREGKRPKIGTQIIICDAAGNIGIEIAEKGWLAYYNKFSTGYKAVAWMNLPEPAIPNKTEQEYRSGYVNPYHGK